MTQLTDRVNAIAAADGCPIVIEGDVLYVGEMKSVSYLLPPGSWRFLFTTKAATEEQLTSLDYILQHHNFKEWFIDFCNRLTYFFSRKESLESLLLSKKLNPKNNYVLIEKL